MGPEALDRSPEASGPAIVLAEIELVPISEGRGQDPREVTRALTPKAERLGIMAWLLTCTLFAYWFAWVALGTLLQFQAGPGCDAVHPGIGPGYPLHSFRYGGVGAGFALLTFVIFRVERRRRDAFVVAPLGAYVSNAGVINASSKPSSPGPSSPPETRTVGERIGEPLTGPSPPRSESPGSSRAPAGGAGKTSRSPGYSQGHAVRRCWPGFPWAFLWSRPEGLGCTSSRARVRSPPNWCRSPPSSRRKPALS